MALLPELVWCECCMASMSQVRRPDRGDQVRLRTIGTIPGPSDSSRRQLLQQRLRLLQIERIEALGKPAVDRSEQFASLLRLPPITPEPRHAHRCAQFQRLCLLPAGDCISALEISFCLGGFRLGLHQYDLASNVINLGLE